MTNKTSLKNELIFQYAAGTASLSKSLMAATYLFLNSRESSTYSQFEGYCAEEFKNVTQIKPINLKPSDCLDALEEKNYNQKKTQNPINNFIDNLKEIKWKKVFNGFYEHSFDLSNKERAKLIKMQPGAKVPLHTHNGKEFILVLEGSFSDEYGTYSRGDLQINDSRIKHTPVSCPEKGCICLTITENDLVFFGPFAPLLNIFTLFTSFFKSKK